jgi:hypothetical protein
MELRCYDADAWWWCRLPGMSIPFSLMESASFCTVVKYILSGMLLISFLG